MITKTDLLSWFIISGICISSVGCDVNQQAKAGKALGDTVAEAAGQAYDAVSSISWDGAYYRRDIGHRAIAREQG